MSSLKLPYVLKTNIKPPPWWSDSQKLANLMRGVWSEVSAKWAEKVTAAFENGDEEKIEKLLKETDKLGLRLGTGIEDESSAILKNVYQKAHAAWMTHGAAVLSSTVTDFDTEYQAHLQKVHAAQVKRFTETHPNRILHPEIVRQLELMRDYKARGIDLLRISERVDRILRQEAQFENASSVHVARLWHADGILLAQENGVITGYISGPIDKKTCPVCRRLVGTRIEIESIAEKIRRDIEITDIDEYKVAWAFPRKDVLDRQAVPNPAALRQLVKDKGYLTPFHNRCRHDVKWLGRGAKVELPEFFKRFLEAA